MTETNNNLKKKRRSGDVFLHDGRVPIHQERRRVVLTATDVYKRCDEQQQQKKKN